MTLRNSADGFVNRSWHDCATNFFNLISPDEFTEPYNDPISSPDEIIISLGDEVDWDKKSWADPRGIYDPTYIMPLDGVEVVAAILQNPLDIQFAPRPAIPSIVCRSLQVVWGTYPSSQIAWGLLDYEQLVDVGDQVVFFAESMKIKMTSTDTLIPYSVKEAVLLRTAFLRAYSGVVTTIQFQPPVFDFANNISVQNNTFTPVAGGVYLIDINLTSWPYTEISSSGAGIFCQIYKDGTTPPTLDTSYGSSHYYPEHGEFELQINYTTVSLSWTSVLEANVAYKFSLWHNNHTRLDFYNGTSTVDSTLRVTKI